MNGRGCGAASIVGERWSAMGITSGMGEVTSRWLLPVVGRGVGTAEPRGSDLEDITGISWIGEGGE